MTLAQTLAIGYLRLQLKALLLFSKKAAARRAFTIFCTPMRKSVKPVATTAIPENISFELEGHRVAGYRWNHPQQAKVLLLHGFESSAASFSHFVDPLLQKNYEVIAFDAPAHGHSGGRQVTLPMYIETIRKINRLYGSVTMYIAHSFGGLALAHFLETHQHDASTKAVFIAPATETTTAIDFFFQLLRVNGKLREAFDELIHEKSGEWPSHFSIRRAMKHIRASVLWVHDERDELTPIGDALKIKEDKATNVEFVITKGLGHSRIYRDPDMVQRIIAFL